MRPKHLMPRAIIAAPLLALALAANTSAPREYTLDQSASELTAKVAFFGLSSKTMTIPKVSGDATIVPGAPERAAIDVTFDATSLEAPDETTLKRLRGDKFFWVEKYKTVRFVGKSLKLSSPTRGTVSGNLTTRGVTKAQTLDVKFDSDPNKAGARQAVSFTATTTIDRRKYGMKSYQLIVGNDVKIKFRAKMVPN